MRVLRIPNNYVKLKSGITISSENEEFWSIETNFPEWPVAQFLSSSGEWFVWNDRVI